jgi:hypothetical protein
MPSTVIPENHEKKRKKKFFRFRRILARIHRNYCSLFAGIIVEGILGKKKSKVPKLKEIETLRGSIDKIETLVAELKVVANFRGVNNIFP